MKIIRLTELIPSAGYSIQVRGKSVDGRYTGWSSFVNFTAAADTTAPNQPAAPTVTTSNVATDNQTTWTVLVSHNGLDNSSVKLASDTTLLKVYVQEGAAGTPVEIGELQFTIATGLAYSKVFTVNRTGAGTTQYTDPRFSVKAVDRSGNISTLFSTAVQPTGIAWFNAAYISDLTANKINTGTLQAGRQITVGAGSFPIVLKSNSTSPQGQIYMGTGTFGNSNTPFYTDSEGKLSLGSVFKWDPAASITYTISSVSYTSTTATFTTSANHNYSQFDTINVSGMVPASYNGTYYLTTAPTSNTFTVSNTTNAAATTLGNTFKYALVVQSNAAFSGALSAASGTFAGDIRAATGTFTGQISSTTTINNLLSTWNPQFSNTGSIYKYWTATYASGAGSFNLSISRDDTSNTLPSVPPISNYAGRVLWVVTGAGPYSITDPKVIMYKDTTTATRLAKTDLGISNGTTYNFSAYIYANVNNSFGIYVREANAAVGGTTSVISGVTPTRTCTVGAWTRIDVSFTPTTTAGYNWLEFEIRDNLTGYTTTGVTFFWISGVQITPGASVSTFGISRSTTINPSSTVDSAINVSSVDGTIPYFTVSSAGEVYIRRSIEVGGSMDLNAIIYTSSNFYNAGITGARAVVVGPSTTNYQLGQGTTSSQRYKTQIENYSWDKDMVLSFDTKRFKYMKDIHSFGDKASWYYGLIAEDLDGTDAEWLMDRDDQGRPDYIYWSERMPQVLYSVTQQINEENKQFKIKIQELENRLAALENK